MRGPTQYGPRIQAMAVYLQNCHLLPEDRLAELFGDLLVGADSAKHLDETGFRIGGRGQWLHVLCMPWLTFFRTSERRGSLVDGFRGCLVHDHLKSYFKIADVRHALCNAHHLRELQALAELDGEA